jgi:hypothetical protein
MPNANADGVQERQTNYHLFKDIYAHPVGNYILAPKAMIATIVSLKLMLVVNMNE